MRNVNSNDINSASEAVTEMINKSELAQAKFHEGTSQYSLLKNRIRTLKIALSILDEQLGKTVYVNFETGDLEKAVTPIKSLISKSEKAKIKLKEDTWQYNMLKSNILALNVVLPLILSAREKSSY